MVEPRGTGMALFTLRATNEVRASQFGSAEGGLDAEMVAIAGAIVKQRIGNFDPSTYRDRFQEALRELIEAKMKGLPVKPRAITEPCAGYRSDGGLETQPCARNTCKRREGEEAGEADQGAA